MTLETRITNGGQVSIPASVRRRWQTQRISIEDTGEALVIRPLPDDPLAAAKGSLRLPGGVRLSELRAAMRSEDDFSRSAPTVMAVLDAFALMAFLTGEDAAAKVEVELRNGRAVISAVNLAEVVDILVRRLEIPEAQVLDGLRLAKSGGLTVVAADEPIGELAGRLRSRHYDRRVSPLSLADCVALATSLALDTTLVTGDGPLAVAAEAEGAGTVSLNPM